MLFVAIGGFVGTLGRALIGMIPVTATLVPVTMFATNVLGAFLLGLLIAASADATAGSRESRGRSLRLLLGTGVLGGFTSYSALAMGAAELLEAPIVDTGEGLLLATAYGVGTLVIGGLASWLGLLVGSKTRRAGSARFREGSS